MSSSESEATSATRAILKIALRNMHAYCIRRHLRGEAIEASELWASVGYFAHGDGRAYLNEKRPFTRDEWRKLLEATGRGLDDPYLAN